MITQAVALSNTLIAEREARQLIVLHGESIYTGMQTYFLWAQHCLHVQCTVQRRERVHAL